MANTPYMTIISKMSNARIVPYMALDPTDTRYCPRGSRCESCGAESPDLEVVTLAVLNATLCLTLCPSCAGSGRLPQIMRSTAERLVAAHAAHLRGTSGATHGQM